jgi:hypothetical protein
MSEPWDAAVRDAGEDPPADLAAAVAEELRCLWSDLGQARRRAIKGAWSLECDWLVTRIVQLTRLTEATPWGQIPIPTLLDGTYQGVLRSAGIAFAPPDMQEIAELARESKVGS